MLIVKDLGIRKSPTNPRNKRHIYLAKCPCCGEQYKIASDYVGIGVCCKKCTQRVWRMHDLVGKRFGKLVVKHYAGFWGNHAHWHCVCDCGNEVDVRRQELALGKTRSCGCIRKEIEISNLMRHHLDIRWSVSAEFAEKHPIFTNMPEYNIWMQMRCRCTNPKDRGYKNYGDRGIKVCDRWSGERGFENFLADMGERPSKKHSIDRIDVNGNYEPSNCRWATSEVQANNRRGNVWFTYNGRRINMATLRIEYGFNASNLGANIRRGVDINVTLQNMKRYRDKFKNKRLNKADYINFNREITLDLEPLYTGVKHCI